MIRLIFSVATLLLFVSCGAKNPPYEWRMDSASAFASYTQSFLKDEIIAQEELERAIQSAKSSADLESLGSIYLGKCALNKAVGINDGCYEYQKIAHLINTPSLDAYYRLLTHQPTPIEALPPHYQAFAKAKTFENLKAISKPTSQLIAASLIKERLTFAQKEEMVQLASQYGYKKAVIFWLQESLKNSTSTQKSIVKQKIELLR
ncbi:MAG: hypothetical protein KU38_11240 [Sulfurovum sp. FS08-3]|nr:MAG: hypothetical protein KU38_11240 [Sulfurovum sp. FS08-3]